jgi:hypothetical protein
MSLGVLSINLTKLSSLESYREMVRVEWEDWFSNSIQRPCDFVENQRKTRGSGDELDMRKSNRN